MGQKPQKGDVVTDGEQFARLVTEPEWVTPEPGEDGWWSERPGFEDGWWRAEVTCPLDDDVEGGVFWVWSEGNPVEVVSE